MAVILTIGGVFAAWQYTDTSVTMPTNHGVNIDIELGDDLGAAGKIEATTTTLKYDILKANDDYVAVLTPDGEVTFTFTANTGSDYLMNGDTLTVKWTATLNQNKTVEGASKTVFNEANLEIASATVDLKAQGKGTNTFTLDNDDLKLELNSFTLDTKGEFEKFQTALNGTTITIKVEVVA